MYEAELGRKTRDGGARRGSEEARWTSQSSEQRAGWVSWSGEKMGVELTLLAKKDNHKVGDGNAAGQTHERRKKKPWSRADGRVWVWACLRVHPSAFSPDRLRQARGRPSSRPQWASRPPAPTAPASSSMRPRPLALRACLRTRSHHERRTACPDAHAHAGRSLRLRDVRGRGWGSTLDPFTAVCPAVMCALAG